MSSQDYSENYLKTQGNLAYHKDNYTKAIGFYSKGIQLFPENPVFYLNRAMVYISQHKYQEAVNDSNFALDLDKKNPKVYYRKATALYALGDYLQALETISCFFDLGLSNNELDSLKSEITRKKSSFCLEVGHPERQKFQRLISWLVEGGSIFPKLYLEYYSHDYRGVHCSRDIAKNECVLFVPLSHIITLEMAKAAPVGQKMTAHKLDLYSPKHCYLSTFLLQEKSKPDSFWKPYLDVLPEDFRNFPIFFTDEEMEILAGSPFLDQINERISDIQEDYNSICSVDPGFVKYSLEEFSKARMAISSRIFSIEINGLVTDACVPLADMLNHKRPRQTNWSFSNEKAGFTVEAIENIQKSEEVMDSYGQKCNSRFLLNYGFIVDGNDSNEFPFKLRLSPEFPLFSLKSSHLREKTVVIRLKEMIIDQNFLDFLACLRFFLDEGQEVENLISSFEQVGCEVQVKSYSPRSGELEKKVLEKMIEFTKESLERYGSSLEEDLEKIKGESGNRMNCLKMIIGEKKILRYFLKTLPSLAEVLEMGTVDINNPEFSADQKFYIKHIVIPIHS